MKEWLDFTFYGTVILYTIIVIMSICMAADYRRSFLDYKTGEFHSTASKWFYRLVTISYSCILIAMGALLFMMDKIFEVQGIL